MTLCYNIVGSIAKLIRLFGTVGTVEQPPENEFGTVEQPPENESCTSDDSQLNLWG
ncbi:hypothetical protein LTSEJOH_1803 [Salmonella enterica subsp. enterica serovar Johannesburg str. S5-703]|nr:hypothetical protein LTSEJOH_1803 [Salmonella enterica subsp. enterica serovar Johannesburg str. S5-703]